MIVVGIKRNRQSVPVHLPRISKAQVSSESIQAEFLTVGYSGSKDQPQPVSVDSTPAPQPLVNANGQPIRLLFAVDSQFPRLGGAENQALKLASALREQGAEIEFITPRVIKSEPMSTTHLGFKVQRIDYPHIRFLGSLVLMFKVYRYFIRNADRFDAAHVHVTHLMAASAGYARAKSGLPVITKISGFYEFEGGVLDPRAKFKPLNFLIRRGLRLVDFVQTISSQTQEKLLQAGFTQAQIQFVACSCTWYPTNSNRVLRQTSRR
jgi:glycosyltransferase involved in cell wall biosynthesis